MEREAETVALGEGRQGGGKTSEEGDREKKTKEWYGTWRGETGRATVRPRSPPFQQRGLLLVLPVFHQKQPATAKGEVEAGGQGEVGERAEDAGYDATLLVVIGILADIEEQSMDAHQRPLGANAPAHLAGDPTRNLISKRRARRFLRARPLHSKPQPRTRRSEEHTSELQSPC